MPITPVLSPELSSVYAPVSDFDPYAEGVLDNPYPHYEVLRELGPVVYLQRYGVYAIARHAGIATVLVDKNWKAVTGITDRNLILVKGRVVLEGTGEELRSQPHRMAEYLGV